MRSPISAASFRAVRTCAVGLLCVLTSGCREQASTELRGNEATSSAAERTKTYNCDLEVWADTAGGRNQADVQKLRSKLLAQAGEGTASLVRAVDVELDKYADGATFCAATEGRAKPLRVVSFEGRFPVDLLQRWAGLVSEARFEAAAAARVLRKGDAWFAQTDGKVLWSDDREALDAALTGRLRAGEIDRSKVLAVRMKPTSKMLDVPRLAQAFGLDVADWEFITISMDHGSRRSEFVVTAKSPSAATRVLEVMRSVLDDLRANQDKLPGARIDRLSAEATGAGAALRFAGSLEDLLQVLAQLGPKRSIAHHP